MEKQRTYIAIDLKSFYASVECVERGLDPLTTNLVVADASRTEKTICLAVSPSLKAYGISGRARLFEVVERVRDINRDRLQQAVRQHCAVLKEGDDHRRHYAFADYSHDAVALQSDPSLGLTYIAAPPQMARYMEVSAAIYHIYLKYVAPEDIHVYSIDEVFIDATHYLRSGKRSPRAFTEMILRDVLSSTGITATAGIGTNLYLCKVAMDIVAKHIPPDENGVRIAELDEISYRRLLWTHRPLTDFWRVGRGYARKLEAHGMYTMGDIARCSLGGPADYYNEDLLYKLFGINAELLIDHAWGWEPATIDMIKQYKPETNSLCSGQVLHCPYTADKARLITREMIDLIALDLVDKGLVTDQLVLTIGYDIENLKDARRRAAYKGPVTTDHYGRKVPKHTHGTGTLKQYTNSARRLTDTILELYDRIVDPNLLIRRITIGVNHLIPEAQANASSVSEQLDLFTDCAGLEQQRRQEEQALMREKNMQHAMLYLRRRFGKNAVLKGMNYLEGATTIARNGQVGGHRA